MQADYQIQINDAQGKPHAYHTVALPASKGTDLLLEIAELLGGPIGHFIQALFTMGDQEIDLSDPDSIGALDVDLAGLPNVLERLPQLILKKGGHAFILRIFDQTKRCEVAGSKDNALFRNIGLSQHYDTAFASNYKELLLALRWVLECNFAPFGADGTPSWKLLWEQLTPYLPIVPASETTTS